MVIKFFRSSFTTVIFKWLIRLLANNLNFKHFLKYLARVVVIYLLHLTDTLYKTLNTEIDKVSIWLEIIKLNLIIWYSNPDKNPSKEFLVHAEIQAFRMVIKVFRCIFTTVIFKRSITLLGGGPTVFSKLFSVLNINNLIHKAILRRHLWATQKPEDIAHK